METTDVMVGAWTAYSTQISENDMATYNSVMQNLMGVDYTPLAISKQLVEGENLRFFCNAKGVYPNAVNEAAMIQICDPAGGKAHLFSIERCR